MHGITLEWSRYPDGLIAAVAATGITPGQLRHYAVQAGFTDYSNNESRPVLLGKSEQVEDLLCLLESVGYEIEADEIVMPSAPVTESSKEKSQ